MDLIKRNNTSCTLWRFGKFRNIIPLIRKLMKLCYGFLFNRLPNITSCSRIHRFYSRKIIDDPEILSYLPIEFMKPQSQTENFKIYPEYEYKYRPWIDLKDEPEMSILPNAASDKNLLKYERNKRIQLVNVPRLPIDNSPPVERTRDSVKEHMRLGFTLPKGCRTKAVRGYMHAVLEGLRGNPYLTHEEKVKRIDFLQKFLKEAGERGRPRRAKWNAHLLRQNKKSS